MQVFHQVQALGKVKVLAKFRQLFGYVIVAPANFLKLCSVVYRYLKLKADIKRMEEIAAKYVDISTEEMTYHQTLSFFQRQIDGARGNATLAAQWQIFKDKWVANQQTAEPAKENLPNGETISAHLNKRHRISKRFGFGH
jgi:hypothetical protein